jgi:ABC-2 type transport system permease protein
MRRFLKGLLVLGQKEVKDIFGSPFIYVVSGLYALIIGWLFFNYLNQSKDLTNITIGDSVLRPIFGNMNFFFIFLAPLLTMKAFAEEKSRHTLDLLFSSPLSHWQLILAKYGAQLVSVLFLLLFTVIFPVVLGASGYEDWGVVAANYLGLILSVMAYLSVGLFTSSLTENQIVSALLSFAILLGMMLLVISVQATNNVFVGEMIRYLAPPYHYEAFVRGGIRTYSLVYFISFIWFFLYLTLKSLDRRRW